MSVHVVRNTIAGVPMKHHVVGPKQVSLRLPCVSQREGVPFYLRVSRLSISACVHALELGPENIVLVVVLSSHSPCCDDIIARSLAGETDVCCAVAVGCGGGAVGCYWFVS